MSVKVESTTDSKEAVIAATGKLADGAVEEKQSASDSEETDKSKDAEASETSEEVNEDAEDQSEDGADEGDGQKADQSEDEARPKKKGGFQKRIDKLNGRLTAKEQEAEYWKAEALKAQKSGTATKEDAVTKSADPAGKPKADDFDSHEEFVEALSDWKVDQKFKARETTEKQTAAKVEFDKQVSSYRERVKAFTETHDDFMDRLEAVQDVAISPVVHDLVIGSDLGPEVMYELAHNKEELKRICGLREIEAAREIGKIEARLQKTTTLSADSKVVKKSSAPAPISPVGSKSTGAFSKSPDDMDYREFKKWRESGLRKA